MKAGPSFAYFPPIAARAQQENGRWVPLKSRAATRQFTDMTLVDVTVENPTARPLAIRRIELFQTDLGVSSVEVFRQGFYMPSDPTGFYVLNTGQDATQADNNKPPDYGPRDFVSHTLVVISRPGHSKKILAGFTTFERLEGYFHFNTAGSTIRFSAVQANITGITLAPHQTWRLETLMIAEITDLHQGLARYTDYVARACHARIPKTTTTGWVDWQYYREEKNEKVILQTVKAMAGLKRRGFPLKYVIVDGGWCAYASEWMKPCPKFPDMRRFGRTVRRHGFELGLWLAPYITNVNTEVARHHPGWMVMETGSEKLLHKPRSNVGPCYMVDFTVPAALEWLRKIVRTLVRDWKIKYLKLDGPCLAHYRGGRFHHPEITAIEQVRRSLAVIREECGDQVIVEGEGIYGPSIGYVDTQRTTQDPHPDWYQPDTGRPMLKHNMQNDLASAFLHNTFWHNHRENVILRDFPSPFHYRAQKNPALKESVLPLNEVLFQVSASAMTGGAMLLADPIEELQRNPARIAMISQFLPHYATKCHPIDVFQNGKQSSLYYLPVHREFEDWHVVGIFNWDEAYRNFTVPLAFAGPGRRHAFDFWNEQYLGAYAGHLPVGDVPARGCKLLAIRRVLDRPQLVGSNLHVYQGAVELQSVTWQDPVLRLDIRHFYQQERVITFWAPSRFRLESIRTNARDYVLDDRRSPLFRIQFNGRKRTVFDLKWSRK
ncbi:MAG: alpha-galactosidase [Kiritimatiellae bacterium]|nr:alpha-galactosidase [Kiritimatiellia bacterium]